MFNICNIKMGINHNRLVIQERRQKIWTLITRGMKGYEIAKELNVDPATVSRDIAYLAAQSQNYLNDLAKSTLPFMYQTSIEGIRSVMKECWNIYESTDNNFQRLAALKLTKECHEAVFKLVDEGPSVMYLKQLQEKLIQIESRQIR
jgi:IS30 family transposase